MKGGERSDGSPSPSESDAKSNPQLWCCLASEPKVGQACSDSLASQPPRQGLPTLSIIHFSEHAQTGKIGVWHVPAGRSACRSLDIAAL